MTTDFQKIFDLVENIDISNYSKNRNFIDGSVTKLSPYISRGVISTKFILESLKKRNINLKKVEKFIQELAWRDYWQITWKNKNIDVDLKQKQKDVKKYGVPENIIKSNTGIKVIDKAIHDLYISGYMHNHVRMYIASIICNIGKCHWYIPAQWFYYHLIDGDWGSNALSWQWVCGSNSSKKYIANQENINKYCRDSQKNTFLDHSYEYLFNCGIPQEIENVINPKLETSILNESKGKIDCEKPILIYNYYNLDPFWRQDLNANRVLLLEPSFFKKFPVSDFVFNNFLKLAKNIRNIKIIYSEFNDLKQNYNKSQIYFKEHPTNIHYKGMCDERDWLFKTKSYYPSFFKFWNANKWELKI
tara:strand:+ start:2029 stop:3108 length:1080 start_codon:yes stop_codon:yes gene_type:complete